MTAVRPVRPADVPAVLRAEALCGGGWDDQSLRHSLRQPACVGVVAEAAGEVVGHCLFTLHPGHLAVERVAVHPARRRRGAGAALLARAHAAAAAHGLPALRAWVPDDSAFLAAHLFFKAAGWTAAADEDFLLFERRL